MAAAQAAPITFYTAKVCPFAQRVELAFAEAGAQVNRYFIDLQAKPDWYAPKVNPASKVPAVAYGGPVVPADQPSPESTKIVESLVLLEFVADLYPNAQLLPSSPVDRSRARYFIDVVSNKVVPGFFSMIVKAEGHDALLRGLEEIQSLLPSEGGFAVGEKWSIADAALTPFLGSADLFLRNDMGKYPAGEGPKVHAEIFRGARFARLQKYFADVTVRESWQKTFFPDHIIEKASKALARPAPEV
ncbi:hypothetical protein HETIRDRAFT_436740 [Heterobasidion irregulare TC 32-1]|uniref:GST N-terminal domain-containing protein n=1 Tax=Heterobasidion irregulare (strain TC 32-1) TaxID=747525 RepID=W4JQB5_HETIT|nr:uncharacterized protein HETIRDRAFT_436740 [Heterobasidion irregulare TC 32-1]ETW75728.1 hypothetical protein HETIRDRAFT_436740 [Heterobasidion irregulare TC 32-1]